MLYKSLKLIQQNLKPKLNVCNNKLMEEKKIPYTLHLFFFFFPLIYRYLIYLDLKKKKKKLFFHDFYYTNFFSTTSIFKPLCGKKGGEGERQQSIFG